MRHRFMRGMLPFVAGLCVGLAMLGAVDFGVTPAHAGMAQEVVRDAGSGLRPIGPDPGQGFIRLPGHVLDVIANDRPMAAMAKRDHSDAMTLTLTLKRDDQPGFERYLKDVYDPQSQHYRHFLAQQQITRKFGPSEATYESVLSYLRASGFELIEGSANRLTLTMAASRSQVERAFGLHIRDYEIGAARFFANDADPAFPAAIGGHIGAVAGLSDLARPHRVNQSVPPTSCGGGSGSSGIFSGTERIKDTGTSCPADPCAGYEPGLEQFICRWFGYRRPVIIPTGGGSHAVRTTKSLSSAKTSLRAALLPSTSVTGLDGTGQTIGLLEYDTYHTSDVVDFLNLLGAPASQINQLTEVPVSGGATLGSGEEEVLIDIDAVMTVAPGAKVVVYDAPFSGQAASYTALFNAMINGGVTVISNSWASCEDQIVAAEAQSIDAVLQTAQASGISVFNGAGDSGSTCLDGSADTVAIPASSPSATAVGGTSPTYTAGFTYGGETWWNGSGHNPATGQGGFGVSKFFARPSYQVGTNTSTMRSVPDVVTVADPAEGVVICEADAGGCPTGLLYGGTSLATPLMAAFTALLNQGLGKNVGAFNTAVYPFANTAAFHTAASMGSDFSHVGLGSPNPDRLYLALAQQTAGAVSATVSTVETGVLLPYTSLPAIEVPADGNSTFPVVVRLADANGNFVSGKTVTLVASSGSAKIQPSSAISSANDGSAIFTVTDLTAESPTVTATDTTDGIVLQPSPSIAFVVPPATSASLAVFPTTVPADGTSVTTLTVLMQDSLGRPAPGKVVTIQQGGGHSVISGPSPSVTNSAGQIQFTATDDQNESVTYTAIDVSDGNRVIPGTGTTVTFSGASASDCTSNPPTGANGYVVTSFASGFPATDFNFSNINYSGCPGADNPYFGAGGGVIIPDFETGNVYQTSLSGGAVSSGNIVASLGKSVGTPIYGKDGNLYVARYGTGNGFSSGDVIQIDPATFAIVRELATGLTCPASLLSDPISGDLFFDDQCSGGGSDNPSVFRITSPNGTNPSVTTYATLPVAGGQQEMVFAPNGTLYAISGGFGYTAEVVSVSGTNTATPGTVTVLNGVTPDNGSLNIGQTNADGSAKTLLLHVADSNGGSLETVDITTSPVTVAAVLATGDIGAGVVGPDGCYYVGDHHVVEKLAPSSGPCTLTPTNPGPALSLSPATVSPNPAQGTVQTFTATLKNATTLSGVPVTFQVTGANVQATQVRTNASGQASLSYTGVHAGNDTVTATATDNETSGAIPLSANSVPVTWTAGTHVSYLTLNQSPQGATVNASVTVVASVSDMSAQPSAPAAGQTVTFKLGTATCTGVTNANGQASCALTPTQTGTNTLTASFAGNSMLTSAAASIGFTVLAAPAPPTPAPTVSIAVSPTTVAAGSTATLTWSSTNATACAASGAWSGTEATSGTITVAPSANGSYSYTLACTGAGGAGSATAVLSATLVAVSVTSKSGGGALSMFMVMGLGLLVLLRAWAAFGRQRLRVSLNSGRTFIAMAVMIAMVGCIAPRAVQADTSGSDQAGSFTDPFYVGIRVGSMPLRESSGKIDQGLASLGYADVSASTDSSGAAGTAFVGYSFTPTTALELSYTFRDSTTAHLSGTIPSLAKLTPLLQDTTELTRGYGNIVSLSYAGHFEVLPRFSLEPRLGGFFWATKDVAISLDDRIDHTHEGGGVTAGLTAAYRVWRGLEVGVSVDHFRGFPNNIATLYAGTFEWRFGR